MSSSGMRSGLRRMLGLGTRHSPQALNPVPRSTIRFLTVVAVIWLIVLNAGDYVTTRMLLSRGGSEANPLAGALLASGYLFWIKMGVLCVLGLGAISIPPRVGVMVVAWFAAGLYATAVISNALLLQLT